uniref:Uncharacterized protein n=1 Tax=Calidris pygmaea TaxID=425635 RepID=A0A8C3JIU7_9CHAR
MAARKPLEMLQDESCCSICLGIFQDPVSIHCGHSFCRSCITETWEGLTTNFSCPQCRKTKSRKILRPNRELANVIKKSNVTLDPDMANPHLVLSEERRSRDLPSNPRRFKFEPCVLGSRGFTSGRHHWDVEVHREGTWAIGVAKESLPRDRGLSLNPVEGVWALYHTHNVYKALTSPDDTHLTLRSVPKRIRICLDYEEGKVVFFDAESKEQIFAFPPASFQGERVFPWFMVMFGAQLKLLP